MNVSSKKWRRLSIPSILLVMLAILPLTGVPDIWLLYLFIYFLYLALANMWNLLAGYSGLISLCPAAFIGLAGYTMTVFRWVELPFSLGIIAGGAISALFALVISIPLFRLHGTYFAIGTIVVPEALRVIFFLWRPIGDVKYGKGAGYVVKGATEISSMEMYWIALAVGAISVFLMRYILNSKIGLALTAINNNDKTAASSGINVFQIKLYSFIISAFVTGLAGATFYIHQSYIEPITAFGIDWTMTIILATVIGGIKIEEGPFLGTIIVVIFHFLLARYHGFSFLIQGIILVVIMLLAPQGIIGLLRKTRIYKHMIKLING